MKYLSVCSGIEAATVAWHSLGWTPVAFSETAPFPSAVLAHHYPDVLNLGDMTKYNEWNFRSSIDLLVGGTPCQSYSVAGLREGLDSINGQLMLTYVEIAAKFRPKWLVWENVPGCLSSEGGEDFAAFLATLAGRSLRVPEGGWRNSGVIEGIKSAYGVAWRVLDSQYFGVAQRRRRVFVIGYLGDWRRAAAVLLEQASLCGYHPPSRNKGKGASRDFASSSSESNHFVIDRASFNQGKNAKFASNVHSGEVMETLVSRGPHAVAIPCQPTIGTLCADSHPGSYTGQDAYSGRLIPVVYGIKATAIGRAPENGGNGLGITEELCDTLTTTDRHAVSIHGSQDPSVNDELAHTIGTNQGQENAVCFAENSRAEIRLENGDGQITGALSTGGGKAGQGTPAIVESSMAVRRLTPRECERLQGFSDDYTLIPWKGKSSEECPDGHRYKAIGNSMTTHVMEWIGRRIQSVEVKVNE